MKDALEVLLLIVVANAAPVIAALIFSNHGTLAIDFGKKLKDQQYIFGVTKTWRGLLSSILITSLTAMVLGFSYITGVYIAVFSMLGDLLSSFIKRRFKKNSSTRIIFLDQIPESLLPVIFMTQLIMLNLMQAIAIIISFIIIELILSTLFLRFYTR